ncbi:MAG: hypothetical protein CM15mP96_2570 [Gammaproteobacteria bacterium]|nr:MAG: hypothetical protein CM15mP96_2570 [Gammaproteobacteria bacterium]
MTTRKFFIDTDTASDDAVAILMALEWENVDVLGISIVSGNMPVEQGSKMLDILLSFVTKLLLYTLEQTSH